MKPRIPAIPTNYNGVRFRSRLEARWAVFFDLLGLTYEYEPDKHFTGITNYIPDFCVPALRIASDDSGLIEVKGEYPNIVELERAGSVGAIVLAGPLHAHQVLLIFTGVCEGRIDVEQLRFAQCPLCGAIGFSVPDEPVEHDSRYAVAPEGHSCPDLKAVGNSLGLKFPAWPRGIEGASRVAPQPPIISLALDWATSIRFDDPNLYERLDGHKRSIGLLAQSQAFGSSSMMAEYLVRACAQRDRRSLPEQVTPQEGILQRS